LDVNLSTKPVKCHILCIASYCAERWTLEEVYQKHLESFEMWCWKGKMEETR
jgi:hypothetical protein